MVMPGNLPTVHIITCFPGIGREILISVLSNKHSMKLKL